MPAPRHENSGLSFENRASKHQNQNIRFLPLKRFCKTVSVRKADLVEREIFVRRFPNLPCLLPLLLKQNLLITGKAPPLFSWFLTISSWRWPWCAYCNIAILLHTWRVWPGELLTLITVTHWEHWPGTWSGSSWLSWLPWRWVLAQCPVCHDNEDQVLSSWLWWCSGL